MAAETAERENSREKEEGERREGGSRCVVVAVLLLERECGALPYN